MGFTEPQARSVDPTRHRPGFYERRIHPRVLNVIMNTAETRRIRERVCAPLTGEIVELGFGTGHNLPFRPASVTRVLAADPLRAGRRLAAGRLAAGPADVEFIGLDGEHLLLAEGGMALDALDTYYAQGDPKVLGGTYERRATTASADRRP